MILSRLRKHVLADIAAGNSVLLRSPSGRGKSDFCEQLYKHMKETTGENIGFQSLFLATQCPPDLIGYIFKGEKETTDGRKYAVSEASLPLWMMSVEGKPAWEYDRFFLVLDEFGQGEADVKRASAELLLKGRIGPWALPPYSVRIACTNQGSRYGVSKDFDFVINRRSEYDVTDDVDSWLLWADKPYLHDGREWTVSPYIKAFARQNISVLFEDEPKVQGPWCTPRSLCATDRYLQVIERDGKFDPDDNEIMAGMTAKIGNASAGQLQGWLRYRLTMPQFEQVVADPAGCPLPDRPDKMMIMAYELAARSEKKHLDAVMRYMQRPGMPTDLSVTYITSLIRREKKLIAEPPVMGWIKKNSSMLAFVQSHE